ncbi:MAG: hypothetical protein F4229_16110, partial [Gammaproteobacteria bacterium]|nr:hypothetical protein [Gammaproteobacteria bacterium]
MAEASEGALSWSNFWQSEVATAFVTDEAQQRALRNFWASTSRNWNSGDRILDLGCGNGALATSLAGIANDTGRTFRYTGLD